MTVKVRPPIVSVPVRDAPLVLGAAEKPTVPFPDPDAPDVTVSHAVLFDTAVQAQPDVAVMPTLPLPPPPATA